MEIQELRDQLLFHKEQCSNLEKQILRKLLQVAPFEIGDLVTRPGHESKQRRVTRIYMKEHWQTRELYLCAEAFPVKKDGKVSAIGGRTYEALEGKWNTWTNLTRDEKHGDQSRTS